MNKIELTNALRAFLPAEAVIWEQESLRPYESDGQTAYRQMPIVPVLPHTVEHLQQVVLL
mgnify:CR=1 FL=1